MNITVYLWILRGIILHKIPISVLRDYFRAERRTRFEEIRIMNPTTEVKLYTHIHYPNEVLSGKKFPGIVLIPGAINSSAVFDRRGEASMLAMQGYVVLHWDPEGRGKSSGVEDAAGYAHQDGLHTVLEYLASLPYVDKEKIGVVSYSYGITFSGGVVRYPHGPKIRFWLDWEGPSDKISIEKPIKQMPNRQHLPLHDLHDEEYWIEREAVRFLKYLPCPYLRIQSAQDHAQPDNEHCVQCINTATNQKYRGEGISPWTRVNDGDMNRVNTVYSYPNNQPNYLPKPESAWLLPRIIRYVHELFQLNVGERYGIR